MSFPSTAARTGAAVRCELAVPHLNARTGWLDQSATIVIPRLMKLDAHHTFVVVLTAAVTLLMAPIVWFVFVTAF